MHKCKRGFVKKKHLTPLLCCVILPKVVNMETKLKQAYLYDFYGELLNAHQRSIYEAFFFQDLSLSEIAEEEGISRQGVHDSVRRSKKALEEYENKLHLVEKFLSVRERIGEIRRLVHSFDAGAQESEQEYALHLNTIKAEIDRISNEILEEL